MASITVFVGTGVVDSSIGTVGWDAGTLSLASADDGSLLSSDYTTATNYLTNYIRLPIGDVSSIPSGATINGITVEIERVELVDTYDVFDNSIKLYRGGFVGNNKADTGTEWPTSLVAVTYGGAADLWGTTWTRDQVVNSLEVGIAVDAAGDAGGTRSARIDYVKITINYAGTLSMASSITNTFNGSGTIRGALLSLASSITDTFGGTGQLRQLWNLASSITNTFSGSGILVQTANLASSIVNTFSGTAKNVGIGLGQDLPNTTSSFSVEAPNSTSSFSKKSTEDL